MGNHCIDCDYCGKCALCEGCKPGCPGQAYERALNEWRQRRVEHVEKATAPLRAALREAEENEVQRFAELNPPPPEPKRVR